MRNLLNRKKMSKRRRKRNQKKWDEINALFNAMRDEKGIPEVKIFRHIYGDKYLKPLGRFCRDVGTCHQKVLNYCKEILASKKTSD